MVLLLISRAQTFQGVADDDREEDGVEEDDEGGHCKAEVLAGFSCLLPPKSYGGELSKHSKGDMARSQVLQALPAGHLQHQEENEGKAKGKGQVGVKQKLFSVRDESQGEDSKESR